MRMAMIITTEPTIKKNNQIILNSCVYISPSLYGEVAFVNPLGKDV